MGADMLLAMSRAPHRRSKPDQLFWSAEMYAMTMDRITRLEITGQHVADYGDPDDDSFDPTYWPSSEDEDGEEHFLDEIWEELSEQEQRLYQEQAVRAKLRHAVAEVFSSPRESTERSIGGEIYIFTGGISWGDSPSEIYESLNMIDEFGLWDAPFRDPLPPDDL